MCTKYLTLSTNTSGVYKWNYKHTHDLQTAFHQFLGNQEESKKSYLRLTIGIIRLAPMFIVEKQRKSGGLSLDLREHVHNTYGYVC